MSRVSDPAAQAQRMGGVIGASGGIGAAMLNALASRWPEAEVVGLSCRSTPAVDLLDESSIAASADWVRERLAAGGRSLELARLAHQFAVHATVLAFLMKHFLPLLPRQQRAVFATLSAKAALNPFVRTAAIELARSPRGPSAWPCTRARWTPARRSRFRARA